MIRSRFYLFYELWMQVKTKELEVRSQESEVRSQKSEQTAQYL
ncbi:hypothetical protein [Mastigocoleus testarum]|nr:hypothetical protein [Mastigocoleus testarum]